MSPGLEATLWTGLEAALAARGLASAAAALGAAFDVAAEAHRGQTRSQGDPYLVHPVRVCRVLLDEWAVTDADVLAAALLHDAVEDSEAVTLAAVEERFGPGVRDLVDHLTKPPAAGASAKAARDRAYYERLRAGPPGAALVKAADRVDNLRDVPGARWPLEKKRAYVREARAEVLPLVAEAWPAAAEALRRVAGQVEAGLGAA